MSCGKDLSAGRTLCARISLAVKFLIERALLVLPFMLIGISPYSHWKLAAQWIAFLLILFLIVLPGRAFSAYCFARLEGFSCPALTYSKALRYGAKRFLRSAVFTVPALLLFALLYYLVFAAQGNIQMKLIRSIGTLFSAKADIVSSLMLIIGAFFVISVLALLIWKYDSVCDIRPIVQKKLRPRLDLTTALCAILTVVPYAVIFFILYRYLQPIVNDKNVHALMSAFMQTPSILSALFAQRSFRMAEALTVILCYLPCWALRKTLFTRKYCSATEK